MIDNALLSVWLTNSLLPIFPIWANSIFAQFKIVELPIAVLSLKSINKHCVSDTTRQLPRMFLSPSALTVRYFAELIRILQLRKS